MKDFLHIAVTGLAAEATDIIQIIFEVVKCFSDFLRGIIIHGSDFTGH